MTYGYPQGQRQFFLRLQMHSEISAFFVPAGSVFAGLVAQYDELEGPRWIDTMWHNVNATPFTTELSEVPVDPPFAQYVDKYILSTEAGFDPPGSMPEMPNAFIAGTFNYEPNLDPPSATAIWFHKVGTQVVWVDAYPAPYKVSEVMLNAVYQTEEPPTP